MTAVWVNAIRRSLGSFDRLLLPLTQWRRQLRQRSIIDHATTQGPDQTSRLYVSTVRRNCCYPDRRHSRAVWRITYKFASWAVVFFSSVCAQPFQRCRRRCTRTPHCLKELTLTSRRRSVVLGTLEQIQFRAPTLRAPSVHPSLLLPIPSPSGEYFQVF